MFSAQGRRTNAGHDRGGKVSANCPARKSTECNSPDPAGPHRSTWTTQEAATANGTTAARAAAGTTAWGRPKPTPGRKKPAEGEKRRDTVPFLSCFEAQKLRFQGAAHSAALRGPFSPKIQRTKLCRAAPCRAHWEDRAPCCLGPPPFRQRRVGTAVPRPRL